MQWFRYFNNQPGISDVVSIDFKWHSVEVFVLSIDETTNQYYLTVMDIVKGFTYG